MMDDTEEHGNPTMDRSCSEGKETELHSTKRIETCEVVNKDFINDLPDPILVHILSFLPLKDAVKTVLLRRFGKMWLNMSVLDLDICGYQHEDDDDYYEICDYEEFMDIIHQVWNHPSDSTLDEVRLRFPFPCTFSKNESPLYPGNEGYEKLAKEKNAAGQIEKLIGYAITREVKVLDINFKACDVWLSAERIINYPTFSGVIT